MRGNLPAPSPSPQSSPVKGEEALYECLRESRSLPRRYLPLGIRRQQRFVRVASTPELVAAAFVPVEDRKHLDDLVPGSLNGVYGVKQTGPGGAGIVNYCD